jgi:hypothetical protein
MPLKGSLRDFSLPDLFQLIHFGKKNGTLNITNGDAKGYVCFRNGNVFFATHNWKRPPLGQRLTESGMVTDEQIDEALDLQKSTRKGQRLGNILVELGYLSRESLEVFVEEQIRDAVFHLLRWTEGEFDFDPNQIFPEEDIGLSMTTEDLIMEGSRRLDEWYQIEKKVPSLDSVFKMTKVPGKDATDINLTSEEWLVLYHVDGESSVRDIIEKSGQSALVTCKALYGLVTAGLVVLATEEAAAPETAPGALEEEIEKMEETTPTAKASVEVEAPPAVEPEEEAPVEEAAVTEEVAEAPAEEAPAEEAPAEEAPEEAEEAAAEEPAAKKPRRKAAPARKKPVEDINVGDADEEVLVEEVSAEELELEESRRRKKPRRKARRPFGAQQDAESAPEEAEKEEAPAPVAEEKESIIIHDEEAAPPAAVKEEEPAPGQSLVDYYKSLAMKEASDNDRLLAFQETEDKKKVELAQEYDIELPAEAEPEDEEASSEFEEPEDIPLEWAGHLTRLRGGKKKKTTPKAAGHIEVAALEEEAEPEEEPEVAEAEEQVATLGPEIIEAAEPEAAEALEPERPATGAVEIEAAAEELEFIDELEASGVAEQAEEAIFEEAPSDSVLVDFVPDAGQQVDAVVPEEAIVEPDLDEVPPAAANFVTMEQEMEQQALGVEQPVEALAEPEPGEEEGLAFFDETEMTPVTGSDSEAETVAEEVPLIEAVEEARIPTEDEIEQLLQVTPKSRDLSREELLAFDQPTYPIVESREAAGEVEALEIGEEEPAEVSAAAPEQEAGTDTGPPAQAPGAVPAGAQPETGGSLGRVLQFKSSTEAAVEVDLIEGAPVVDPGETEELVTSEDIALDIEVEPEPETEPEPVAEVLEEPSEAIEELVEETAAAEEPLEPLEEVSGEEAEVLQIEEAASREEEGVPPLAIEEPEELEMETAEETAEVIPIDAKRQPPPAIEELVEETELSAGEASEAEEAATPAEVVDEIAALEEALLEEAVEEPAEEAAELEEETEEIVFGDTTEAEGEAAVAEEAETLLIEAEPVTFESVPEQAGQVASFESEPVLEGAEPVTLGEAPAAAEPLLTQEPAVAQSVPEPAIAAAGDSIDARADIDDGYFDGLDELRELTGGKSKSQKAKAEEVVEPEPEPEPEEEMVSAAPPVTETVLEDEEEAANAFDEDDEGFGMKVRGKRGAGTSLVDLETFELEQELLELAGGVKETRRHITQSEKEAMEGKHKKEKKSRSKGSKEVDKGSVKKIIDDLKKM